ncbi:MAG: hypothetical protein ACJ72W_29800 [Actinoallomurus sp.]
MVTDAVTCLLAAALTLVIPVGPAVREVRVRDRWRPPARLVRVTVAGTAFAYGYLGVAMFVPLVLLQRGAPPWLPGLIMAGAALLAPLAARLSHRRLETGAHTRVLGAGSPALGVLALLMTTGQDLVWTVPAYLAWTATGGVLLGRWQAMIAEMAPEPDRPRCFAFSAPPGASPSPPSRWSPRWPPHRPEGPPRRPCSPRARPSSPYR